MKLQASSMNGDVVATPEIDLPLVRRGKVRDVYALPPARKGGEGRLLLVASDRVSAFDVVMPTPIPDKGRMLTAMSAFWFGFLRDRGIVETHVLSTDVADVPASAAAEGSAARAWLAGRVTIGRACSVIPIECVVRGYLEGSGLKEYRESRSVCGVALPKGLRQCDRLPEPIFTPATKEASGHDQNISFERASELVGLETMGWLRDVSLKIYTAAAEYALARGIIIADTKFEFGVPMGIGGTAAAQGMGGSGGPGSPRVWVPPILIDEVLTPDSSRFWPAAAYEPGRAQASYDKQYLREYLETLVASGTWDKTPPGPKLPASVVEGTAGRYREALAALCGR